MENSFKSLLLRKLTVTFVTTTILSVFFVIVYFSNDLGVSYNQGNDFIGWFVVYAMFIGLIILIYGNIVSITIEYLQRKWFQQYGWLYVLILGLFGLANGVLFHNAMAALFGMIAAIIYGILDKWLYKRTLMGKSIKPFFVIPLASLVLCWGCLELISPPRPPFTKEDAVDNATSSKGTIIDKFPEDIGKREGTIGEYQVIRETSAEEVGKEIYIVTFTEIWKKGNEKGTWTLSYKVDRQSSTLYSKKGDIPFYNMTQY